MKSSMEVIIIAQWKKCTFEDFALLLLRGLGREGGLCFYLVHSKRR